MPEDLCKECNHSWIEHPDYTGGKWCKHKHCLCPKWIWNGEHPGSISFPYSYMEAVKEHRIRGRKGG